MRTSFGAQLLTGQVVAVKRLNISDSDDIPAVNRQSFQNEIESLTEVRHRNIIKLYGFCSWSGQMFLVYEHVQRGSMGKVLYGEETKLELSWATRLKIVQGIAHAISYLQSDCSPAIVHRDVTLNNILLDSDLEPRLGTAKLLSSNTSTWTSVAAGLYGYMAPGTSSSQFKF
ncbi:MDIS1-interacting receptor like kinase 2 [Glycine max]|uniref:MDIS1-interacting receptor like kinase 2 n=1 Tax=Glycine max TaxID=3847 RepID=UPI001B35549D|nr:MDIS1-interacting receptor like kinase 2-like [Glycine max]